MYTLCPPKWRPDQIEALRLRIVHAVCSGVVVRCPEDDTALAVDPSYGIAPAGVSAANVTCPGCGRFAHIGLG